MKCVIDMGSGAMMYIPSLMTVGSGVQGILKFCLRNLRSCNVGIMMKGIYEVRVEMGSVYLMPIGSGVRAILGFSLSNLRICNVGIIDERDL
jgi:hypothetical protein